MRDYRIDAAKGALIILVVLGHFLEAVDGWAVPLARAPLTAIYMMHMPAFVFLAGMTTKVHGTGKRIATYAVLLAAFQMGYLLPINLMSEASKPILQPYWLLWFLLSMIFWTALLPVFTKLKHPLFVAVLLSLAVGIVPLYGYHLSFSRTFVFLPFFVAGHLYGWSLFKILPKAGWPLVASAASIMLAATELYSAGLDRHWLFGSLTFNDLNAGFLEGIATRAALLLTAAITMTCAFCLVPSTKGLLSTIGSRSLAIFLLHGFLVILGGKVLKPIIGLYGLPFALGLAIFMSLASIALLTLPVWDRSIRFFANSAVELFGTLRQSLKPRQQ